jgi:hypothetical protein
MMTKNETLYGCDVCGKSGFHRDEMATLGGDRYITGFGPQAYPAECIECQKEYFRQMTGRRVEEDDPS